MFPLLYIKNGYFSFANKEILNDLDIYIYSGDKICLIGKNGCGKSSLMKILNREYELDEGEFFLDKNISSAYLKQDVNLNNDQTIYEYLSDYLSKNKTNTDHDDFSNDEGELENEQIENEQYKIDIFLNNLDLDGNLNIKHASGGQIRRILLIRTLLSSADILLLDEPTNHLDIKGILWLEDYLRNYKKSFICISHDIRFLENITNKIWWLDRAILRKHNKGFKHYEKWQEEVIRQEEIELKKLNQKLEEEKHWLSRGVTARRKRNQKRLHHLKMLRIELQEHKNKLASAKSSLQIKLSEEAKKSKFIIETKNLSYSYDGKNNIIEDVNIKIKKGEKIGIIGANGCGKSSLIKLLIKELAPKTGSVKHADNIEISYFDQYRKDLIPHYTIQNIMCPSGGDRVFLKDRDIHVASYLKQFMFDPKGLQSKISTLSGGQASRLLLAKILVRPGNFLILDEPTNDLDLDSLEILLEILSDYDGTLIVVSHDRDFIDRLVTRLIVFDDDENDKNDNKNNNKSKIIDLYGGYSDYLKMIESQNSENNENSKNKKNDLIHNKKNIITNNKTKKKNATKNRIENNSEKNIKEEKSNKNIKSENNIEQSENKTKKKISYKYQRLLEILPQEIEELEDEIKSLEEKLSQNDFFEKERDDFIKTSKILEEKQKTLEEKINLWIEIESE